MNFVSCTVSVIIIIKKAAFRVVFKGHPESLDKEEFFKLCPKCLSSKSSFEFVL